MVKKLLLGNEAFAQAALEAGVNVVAGYPGTPSSELVETVAKLHAAGKAKDVYVEWSTNEAMALEVAAAASYAGARALFTCKNVGMNVASDALMSLNYVGVNGGMVLFVADDPGPISSQTEQDTRRYAAFAKVPVLDPATPDQGFEMMKAAFELSERHHTPVIVRPTTRINHASTYFEVAEETCGRALPKEPFEGGPKYVILPVRAYAAHKEVNERLDRMASVDFVSDPQFNVFNPMFEYVPDELVEPKLGILCGGVSTAYAREALAMLQERAGAAGIQLPAYRFMQVGTPYPFPKDLVSVFMQGLEDVLVIEEQDCFLEDQLNALSGERNVILNVFGKLTGNGTTRGENSVDDCLQRLGEFLGVYEETVASRFQRYVAPESEPLPVRPPTLCAGCPHRGSFYAIKKALGKREAVLCGDIGCYTLGSAAPLKAVETCLCMGAGITMAQGFSVVKPGAKCIGIVGDSTFFASGLPGLTNAVYNQHDITVVVLDNATTAMTGAQPHPGTGITLMGPKHEGISIPGIFEACGFKKVLSVNPLDLEASVAAAKEAIDFEGPSALVFVSPCIQLTKPGKPVSIDPDLCTGCKRCITSIGCPGIAFDAEARGPKSGERGQAYVDPSLCNGCTLCTQVCPFHAIEKEVCDD